MRRISSVLIAAGSLLILFSLGIFIFTFYPVIFAEIKYRIHRFKGVPSVIRQNVIQPVDDEFGIVIPKIGANARVIANVDPYNPKEYQWQLTKGVAHAKGTSLPTQSGNIFIFSHSSVNFYEANRYNSVFYLLSKMEKGDEVYLFYNKQKFKYKVVEIKKVNASSVAYLGRLSAKNTLTLMTCWPPGTTLKRLLIIADLSI